MSPGTNVLDIGRNAATASESIHYRFIKAITFVFMLGAKYILIP